MVETLTSLTRLHATISDIIWSYHRFELSTKSIMALGHACEPSIKKYEIIMHVLETKITIK